MAGHEANQKIISFIEEIKAEIGKPKFEFASLEPDHDMFEMCIRDRHISMASLPPTVMSTSCSGS